MTSQAVSFPDLYFLAKDMQNGTVIIEFAGPHLCFKNFTIIPMTDSHVFEGISDVAYGTAFY